jgi:hypothetical protein
MADVEVREERDATALDPADLLDDLRAPLEAAALTCLATTFKKAADSLFDRAYRGDTASIRSSCLAAMRSLHRDRDAITRRFKSALDDALKGAFGVGEHANGALSANRLARGVVACDQTVIDATVERVRHQHEAALTATHRRLAPAIAVQDSVDGHPFGPETLVHALAEALGPTDIELRPRLLVYRAFERALIDSLGALLDQLNKELDAAGLTPQTPFLPGRSVSAGRDTAGNGQAQSTLDQAHRRGDDEAPSAGASSAGRRRADSGAAAGKRVAAVRQAVKKLVEERLQAEPDLSEVPARFLRRPWAHVLLASGVKCGVGGELWTHHQRLMEWLLRSFRPVADDRVKRRVEREFPALLRRLRAELLTVTSDREFVANQIEHLRTAHAGGRGESAGGGVANGAAGDKSQASAYQADNVVVARFDKPGNADPEPNGEVMRELHLLPLCSWFAFRGPQGERMFACLQARVDDGERYIFADRHGNRMAEYALTELAEAVTNGTAAPVDDGAPAKPARGQRT